MVVRQRLPVFQALFFSSAVVCLGSATAYITFTYCGVSRETRNTFLRVTVGIASSWFVFFLCRSYERFCRHWMWVPMAVGLAQVRLCFVFGQTASIYMCPCKMSVRLVVVAVACRCWSCT